MQHFHGVRARGTSGGQIGSDHGAGEHGGDGDGQRYRIAWRHTKQHGSQSVRDDHADRNAEHGAQANHQQGLPQHENREPRLRRAKGATHTDLVPALAYEITQYTEDADDRYDQCGGSKKYEGLSEKAWSGECEIEDLAY